HQQPSSFFFFYVYGHHRHLHSFPTRRSSDLARRAPASTGRVRNRYWKSCTRRSPRCVPSSPAATWLETASAWKTRSATCCSWPRSEEHTSELQSRENLVCRLLLEKKNKQRTQ